MIEVVFFDAGETILSPQPNWSELSVKVLRDRGHTVDVPAMQLAWRDVGPRFRAATDEGIQFSLDPHASRTFWTALYTDLLERLGLHDEGAPLALYGTFSDPNNYRLFPDALPALESLRADGRRLGIISNFETWLEGLLGQLGVLPMFDVVAISGELGWEKPDPRIFEWAVGRAGVAPESCVHIGDQPFFDADASAACGLRAVLLDRFGRWADIEATYPRIGSLAELHDAVRTMDAAE